MAPLDLESELEAFRTLPRIKFYIKYQLILTTTNMGKNGALDKE